jgi:hypothetical protein
LTARNRKRLEDAWVSMAYNYHLHPQVNRLPPRLWEALRLRLQGTYREATGEEHATLIVYVEERADKEAAYAFLAAALNERDQWKANHDQMVQRNAVLRERPDLPADRLPSIARYEAELESLRAQVQQMHRRAQKAEGIVSAALHSANVWNDICAKVMRETTTPTGLPRAILDDIRRVLSRAAVKGGSNG